MINQWKSHLYKSFNTFIVGQCNNTEETVLSDTESHIIINSYVCHANTVPQSASHNARSITYKLTLRLRSGSAITP